MGFSLPFCNNKQKYGSSEDPGCFIPLSKTTQKFGISNCQSDQPEKTVDVTDSSGNVVYRFEKTMGGGIPNNFITKWVLVDANSLHQVAAVNMTPFKTCIEVEDIIRKVVRKIHVKAKGKYKQFKLPLGCGNGEDANMDPNTTATMNQIYRWSTKKYHLERILNAACSIYPSPDVVVAPAQANKKACPKREIIGKCRRISTKPMNFELDLDLNKVELPQALASAFVTILLSWGKQKAKGMMRGEGGGELEQGDPDWEYEGGSGHPSTVTSEASSSFQVSLQHQEQSPRPSLMKKVKRGIKNKCPLHKGSHNKKCCVAHKLKNGIKGKCPLHKKSDKACCLTRKIKASLKKSPLHQGSVGRRKSCSLKSKLSSKKRCGSARSSCFSRSARSTVSTQSSASSRQSKTGLKRKCPLHKGSKKKGCCILKGKKKGLLGKNKSKCIRHKIPSKSCCFLHKLKGSLKRNRAGNSSGANSSRCPTASILSSDLFTSPFLEGQMQRYQGGTGNSRYYDYQVGQGSKQDHRVTFEEKPLVKPQRPTITINIEVCSGIDCPQCQPTHGNLPVPVINTSYDADVVKNIIEGISDSPASSNNTSAATSDDCKSTPTSAATSTADNSDGDRSTVAESEVQSLDAPDPIAMQPYQLFYPAQPHPAEYDYGYASHHHHHHVEISSAPLQTQAQIYVPPAVQDPAPTHAATLAEAAQAMRNMHVSRESQALQPNMTQQPEQFQTPVAGQASHMIQQPTQTQTSVNQVSQLAPMAAAALLQFAPSSQVQQPAPNPQAAAVCEPLPSVMVPTPAQPVHPTQPFYQAPPPPVSQPMPLVIPRPVQVPEVPPIPTVTEPQNYAWPTQNPYQNYSQINVTAPINAQGSAVTISATTPTQPSVQPPAVPPAASYQVPMPVQAQTFLTAPNPLQAPAPAPVPAPVPVPIQAPVTEDAPISGLAPIPASVHTPAPHTVRIREEPEIIPHAPNIGPNFVQRLANEITHNLTIQSVRPQTIHNHIDNSHYCTPSPSPSPSPRIRPRSKSGSKSRPRSAPKPSTQKSRHRPKVSKAKLKSSGKKRPSSKASSSHRSYFNPSVRFTDDDDENDEALYDDDFEDDDFEADNDCVAYSTADSSDGSDDSDSWESGGNCSTSSSGSDRSSRRTMRQPRDNRDNENRHKSKRKHKKSGREEERREGNNACGLKYGTWNGTPSSVSYSRRETNFPTKVSRRHKRPEPAESDDSGCMLSS